MYFTESNDNYQQGGASLGDLLFLLVQSFLLAGRFLSFKFGSLLQFFNFLITFLLYMSEGIQRTLLVISIFLNKMVLSIIEKLDAALIRYLFLANKNDTLLFDYESDRLRLLMMLS